MQTVDLPQARVQLVAINKDPEAYVTKVRAQQRERTEAMRRRLFASWSRRGMTGRTSG